MRRSFPVLRRVVHSVAKARMAWIAACRPGMAFIA
jgi:hypothetical protein